MNAARVLHLSREIAQLNQLLAGEAARKDPSRGFIEAYAARLLKRAAETYAAALPDPAEYKRPMRDPQIDAIVEIWDGRRA